MMLTAFWLLSQTPVYAKILRVGIDYNTIALAHTAAVAGDTLQIYGYQSGTINKRLVILGFGYNLDMHANLQAIGTEAPSTANITFQTGSDSSIAEGLELTASIYVSKVIIRRCRGDFYINNFSNPVSDVKIISCVLLSCIINYATHPCTNLQIYNCILGGTINANTAGSIASGSVMNCVTAPTTLVGNANYLYLGAANFLVKNTVIGYYVATNINTIYESNFFGSNQPATLPLGSNNRWAQTWDAVFLRLSGTSDQPGYAHSAQFNENYYTLRAGSPAINGGLDLSGNPTDAGIFGGEPAYRYRVAGIPAVPAIYKLTAPGAAATTNPYNVTISVRSNN